MGGTVIEELSEVLFRSTPARLVQALAQPPVDVWAWLSQSIPAGALVNGLGLGALAVLFATDRVLTKGQHLRRVGDIVKAHEERVTELTSGFEKRIVDLTDAHKARVEDLKVEKDRAAAQYDGTISRLLAERDYERSAKDIERKRADTMATELRDIAQEFGKTAVHLLESLNEARAE